MEENKTMETQGVNTERKELSYDELRNVAAQLQQENMQFRRLLGELNYNNFFNRLNFLFEVLKLSHMFSEQFVTDTVKEVEDSLNSMKNVATTEAPIEDAEVNA